MVKAKNPKILVTGGAGFIGSHLVDTLVNLGHRVRVLDNLSRGKEDFLRNSLNKGMVEFVQGEVQDYQALQRVVDGIKVIFHLAAQASVMGAEDAPDSSFDSNVLGTYRLLQAARSTDSVERIIFASSREVYGDAASPPVSEEAPLVAKNRYGASKIAAEAYCQLYNSAKMRVSTLRLANVYGPRDRGRVISIFIDKIENNQHLTLFGGEQIIDFIYVDYVVDAFVRASQVMPEQPINIGSGKGISVQELAQTLIKISGTKVDVNFLPARKVEVLQYIAKTDRMQQILGITPPDDPLAGVKTMILEKQSDTDGK